MGRCMVTRNRPLVNSWPQWMAAFEKSDEQLRARVQASRVSGPVFTAEGEWLEQWIVPSRTSIGAIYTVDVQFLAGGYLDLTCDCPSTHGCWHIAHVLRLVQPNLFRVEELPSRNILGYVG